MRWSDVSEENQKKIKKEARQLASRIYKSVEKAEKLPNPLFRSFFFQDDGEHAKKEHLEFNR